MAKKKIRSNLKILLILGILVLCSSLIFVKNNSNVLGTNIAAGKQLQIDWFRPNTTPPSSSSTYQASPAPTNSAPSTGSTRTTPRPSNAVTPSASIYRPPSPPPLPLPICQGDPAPKTSQCQCVSYGILVVTCQGSANCPNTIGPANRSCQYMPGDSRYSTYLNNPQCRQLCFGKPVIYLYPTKPTMVDVLLTIPGRITESIPTYPEGGWQKILANPDGTLFYQNQAYHELYYETEVSKIIKPTKGLVIPTASLKQELTIITTKLGLIPHEQEAFLEYWMPRLNSLKSPYIFFSVLTPAEKDSVDRVSLTPKPDTRIEFLVYFKPLYQPIRVTPLSLPPSPPARVGFTMVEWGGTIDYN